MDLNITLEAELNKSKTVDDHKTVSNEEKWSTLSGDFKTLNENKDMVEAVRHNSISSTGVDTSFIKSEQECLEVEYSVKKSSLTEDAGVCFSALPILNYANNISDNMIETQQRLSKTIIKSESLEFPEGVCVKKENTANDDDSSSKDIEAVYIPTVYKGEKLGEEDISEDEKEKLECTTVMDTVSSDKPKMDEKSTVTNIQLKCDVCDRTFTHKYKLKRHKLSHVRQFTCEYCDKAFTFEASLNIHKRSHTGEKPFECNHCGKCFSQNTNLLNHIRIHTGEKPYKCDQCGKGFTLNGSLTKHKRTHTGEKPYKCDLCGKGYSCTSNLVSHKRRPCTETFKCDQCDKIFNFEAQLIKHKVTHTVEKIFKCDFCEKICLNKYNLESHRRQHTGERPYKCDLCERSFANRSNYITHTRRPCTESYKCDQCGKQFTFEAFLNRHKLTHTDEKPFKCGDCDKSFSSKFFLAGHQRTHAAQKSLN